MQSLPSMVMYFVSFGAYNENKKRQWTVVINQNEYNSSIYPDIFEAI